MNAYLIIDIGTGSTRVGLVETGGRILAMESKAGVYTRDRRFADGWSFDPLALWEDVLHLCGRVLMQKDPGVRVAAVTATSARESIVLIARDGVPFLGLPNIDNRGRDFTDTISKKDEIYAATGRWVSPVFSALKLVGLRETDSEAYARIDRITSISDFIGMMFTGECVYEYSQACETQLLDIRSLIWSDSLCQSFGVDKGILPPLACAGEVLAKPLPALADGLGLPSDAVFITGGADTQMAVLGAFADTNDLVLVSGTTSPLVRIVDRYILDTRQRWWLDCHLYPKQYLLENNAGVTGLNYQRFVDMFFKNADYRQLDRILNKKLSHPCIASLGTLIFERNQSLQNGGFCLSAPIAADVDCYDFIAAIANDIAFSISANYFSHGEILRGMRDFFYGCGGGLRSDYLAQTIATVTGRALVLREGYTQSSLLGCAALCNQTLGIDMPIPPAAITYEPKENRAELLELYSRWQDYRDLLNPR